MITENGIYLKKRSIEEFGVDEKNTVNNALFDVLLQIEYIGGNEDTIVRVFNDAYYVCTALLLEKRPYFKIAEYENALLDKYAFEYNRYGYVWVVMSMVAVYLIKLDITTDDTEKTINAIKTRYSGGDEKIYEKITGCVFSFHKVIDASTFYPLHFEATDGYGKFWKNYNGLIEGISQLVGKINDDSNRVYNEIVPLEIHNNSKQFREDVLGSKTENLIKRIKELEEELQSYKEKSKHIDAAPAAALFWAIAQMTDSETCTKEKVAKAVSKIFGWKVNEDDGSGHVRNRLCGSSGGITNDHKEEVAKLVEEAMPKLAAKIRKL
jgi:hypothetical protein